MDFSWLWIVPVLGVLVLVHEMGHFFSARFFGIRVEEFGIGLPPRMFAIRRNNIDYSVNWLPIGGFVKILGENGESDAPDSFNNAPAWQRIIVLAAGVTMNLITALVLFFVFYLLGQNIAAGPPMIGDVQGDGAAAAAHLQKGDIVLSIAGQAMTSVNQMHDFLETRRGQETPFLIDRDGVAQTLAVTPHKDGLALGITFGADQGGPLSVQTVDPASQAAKSGLQGGDVLIAVNGKNVPTLDRLNQVLNAAKGTATVAVQYVRLVDRSDLSAVYLSAMTDPSRQQTTNIELGTGGLVGVVAAPPITHIAATPTEAVGQSFNAVGTLLQAIPASLLQVIKGQAPASSFAGPIGIAQITAEVSKQSGLQGLLWLTGVLGVNLALVNILPLPALDGGRILFIIVDRLLLFFGRRRIPPEREGLVHLVGMALLLLLILLISFNDVARLLSGGSPLR